MNPSSLSILGKSRVLYRFAECWDHFPDEYFDHPRPSGRTSMQDKKDGKKLQTMERLKN